MNCVNTVRSQSIDSQILDAELAAVDEALTLGLDPLALDELHLLTDPNLISDPDIENSFRFDRSFNDYRLS